MAVRLMGLSLARSLAHSLNPLLLLVLLVLLLLPPPLLLLLLPLPFPPRSRTVVIIRVDGPSTGPLRMGSGSYLSETYESSSCFLVVVPSPPFNDDPCSLLATNHSRNDVIKVSSLCKRSAQ